MADFPAHQLTVLTVLTFLALVARFITRRAA